jgi:superfamily I DNA/RNA helicase
VDARFVSNKVVSSGKPVVMTMHRAKGMEFAKVLLFGVDASALPASFTLQDIPDADRDDVIRKERSLLYVAASRARDELTILWTGERSDLLPEASGPSA